MEGDGSDAVRGFVLQPTYRIEAGRAVVHLWGRLESGETFLLRDRRFSPYFYLRAADADRARGLGAVRQQACDRRTPAGEPVVRVEVATPPDTPPLRDRLEGRGIRCFEADIPFAIRYLIDHRVRGALAIRGTSRPGRRVGRVFEDAEIAAADWTPRLGVLSFDIETDPGARRLLSIALHGCGAAEVLLVAPPGAEVAPPGIVVESEAELLRRFRRRVRELDPDILTGWNIADFDVPVLLRRAGELGVALALGRGRGATRRRARRSFRDVSRVMVPGRLVLDGLQLLRGAFVRMERYSLDHVAREVLGEGKTLQGPDRAEAILEAWKHDRDRFVAYNLTDARLVSRILERLHLVELAVARSRLTGLPPDRVHASVAAFDFLYLGELGRRGVVAPSVGGARREGPPMAGGEVLEPRPGEYRNVLVFDVKSLYPSIIRTFQIDPLGLVEDPAPGDDLIVAPSGAAFRRDPGILPGLLDELAPRREAARRAGDRVASHAVKILMNSFYGVLGTPVCRFYDPRVANAITSFGRRLLLWSRDRLEAAGLEVLYGDTDSLFVASGAADPEEARRRGEELRERLDRDLAAHLRSTWGVESRLEVELERIYLRLFLPPVRHGAAGARKRYVGLVEEGGERRVVFTGLEAVRRDWTELARRTQRELYERLFTDRPVDDYLRRLVARLRAGELDDQLVYRKALRKPAEAYTRTTPPHVAAARLAGARSGSIVAYLMTTRGPRPAGAADAPPDYDHYVDRQLRPIAEPVLAHLGLDFARVIGDDRQLDLF